MSYAFSGTSTEIDGVLASTYGLPITMACYVKLAVHPVAIEVCLHLGTDTNSENNSLVLRTGSTDNQWACRSINAAGAGSAALEIEDVDGVWAPCVGVIASDASRTVYIKDITQTDTETTSRAILATLDSVAIGQNLNGGGNFQGLIAEVALWDMELDTDAITSYMTGTAASEIEPANLIGYWPLSADNSTQSNLGVDAGGDLAVADAVFDSDHPTITSGGSSTTISPNAAGMSV